MSVFGIGVGVEFLVRPDKEEKATKTVLEQKRDVGRGQVLRSNTPGGWTEAGVGAECGSRRARTSSRPQIRSPFRNCENPKYSFQRRSMDTGGEVRQISSRGVRL